MGRTESDLQVEKDPESKRIRRITYNNDEEGVALTAGLPEDFSGREGDATRWILAMKAYFIIQWLKKLSACLHILY